VVWKVPAEAVYFMQAQVVARRIKIVVVRVPLKVPKREIFVTELFLLSDPIWVGDLRTEPKKHFM
jgi:hypothetical protein